MKEHMPTVAAEPGSYYFIEGEPSMPKNDLKNDNLTFGGMERFCTVRKDAILEKAAMTHFAVKSAEQTMTLVVEEHGGHRAVGAERIPGIYLTARARETEDHKVVKSMMTKSWDAHDLGKHIQTLRHLFADNKDGWSALVSRLRNMRHQVAAVYENSSTDQGQRKQTMEKQLEQAPMIEFTVTYKLYEDTPEQNVTLFVAYDCTNQGVSLRLLSENLIKQERDTVTGLIDKARTNILKLVGDAIPIVDVN